MSDASEEKVLPPSEHKLRKAREKGQVPSSQDFVAGAVTLSALVYILFAWPSLVRAMEEIFRLTVASAPFTARDGIARSFHSVLYLLGGIVVPFGIVTALAAIVANMIHKRGIPFSVHPVIPDFSRINPGQMMKKVFSKRNATEFGISLFRITVWFVVAGLVLWLAATDILASATCGGPCIGNIAVRIGIVLFAALFIMLVVFGLADLPLQTALFNHEQKMGHKEFKRELKDTMGNSEFKAHRRGQYGQMLETPAGGSKSTMLLAGRGIAVSLFYHPKDAPVPRVVARHASNQFRDALVQAKKNGVPVLDEADLAHDIYQAVAPGSPIRERHFGRIAMAMVRGGLL
jgi:type III secretion protein U